MFYLTTFYKSIFKYPIRSLMFIIVGVGIVSMCLHSAGLREVLSKSMPTLSENPYFYALIAKKKNYQKIARRLRELPGVSAVGVLSRDAINKKARHILGQSGISLDENMSKFNYSGIKVTFVDGLNTKSQNLIRSYLGRLTGDQYLTLGAIKNRKRVLEENSFINMVRRISVPAIIFILSILWIICGVSYRRSLNKISFMVENYQRREKVLPKLVASGLLGLFLLGFVVSIALGTPNFSWLPVAIVPFGVIFLYYIKRSEWQS